MKEALIRAAAVGLVLGSCILFWVIVAISILACIANAETGLDTLALAKMDAAMIGQEIDPNSALGWLEKTFGDAHSKAAVVLNTGKVTAVRVHLVDGTCIRNNVCPPGAPNYNSFRELNNRAASLNSFMSAYPNIKVYWSPFLEHDEKNSSTVRRWYREVGNKIPRGIPVCSAFTGWCPPGVIRERHGNQASGEITSNDGESIFDSNSIRYRTSGKIISFAWFYEMNGRVSGEKTFISPLLRHSWPTRALIRQAVRVMRPATPAPTIVGCPLISSEEIGKTNAEQYENPPDDRGNKYLYIAKEKRGNELELDKIGGQSVGCLRYYGPFVDGRSRYYIGTCSHESPPDLMDQLGGEWGLIKWQRGCRVFNAIRRTGQTRP